MAEMKGGMGNGLSDKGRRSKAEANNKSGGQPEMGLGTTRGAKAGTPKEQADLNRKGSTKPC